MSHLDANDRNVLCDAYGTGADLAARQHLYHYQTPRYDLARLIAEQLADVTGTVADVGCGNGRILTAVRMARPDLVTVGVDLSLGIMTGVAGPLVVADAQHMPFRDGVFDGVIAAHMIYHLRDINAGLVELARVLRPGGRLVATTNAEDDKRELDELWADAAADVLGVSDGPRRVSLSSRFPLDDAPAVLAKHFSDIRVTELPGVIAVTDPGPVIEHLGSYRAWAAQAGVPFAETVQRAGQLVAAQICRHGVFTISCRGGIVRAIRPSFAGGGAR